MLFAYKVNRDKYENNLVECSNTNHCQTKSNQIFLLIVNLVNLKVWNWNKSVWAEDKYGRPK